MWSVEYNMRNKIFIAVIGGSKCSAEISRLAEQVGEQIAKAGAVLVCGGLSGVMEASCRGAKKAGGLTIGILPGFSRKDANPYVDIPVVTGISYARNIIVVRSADAVIAVDGNYGTLSEIGHALSLGIPVIGLSSWDVDENIHKVSSPLEAVDLAVKLALK